MQVSRWGQRRRGLHLGFAVRAQSRPTVPQTEPSRRRLRRQHRGARVQHRAQALQVPGLLRLHSGRRGARPGPLLRARRSHLLSALAPRLHEDNRQRAKGGGGRGPEPLEITTAPPPTSLPLDTSSIKVGAPHLEHLRTTPSLRTQPPVFWCQNRRGREAPVHLGAGTANLGTRKTERKAAP